MHNYNLILTLFGSKKCKFTKFHFRHRNRQHRLMSPINIWVKKLIFIFKYNQQDATLLNGIYYYKCTTCFRWFLRPSSGAQNCLHSIGYLSSFFCFLPLSWVSWSSNLQPTNLILPSKLWCPKWFRPAFTAKLTPSWTILSSVIQLQYVNRLTLMKGSTWA